MTRTGAAESMSVGEEGVPGRAGRERYTALLRPVRLKSKTNSGSIRILVNPGLVDETRIEKLTSAPHKKPDLPPSGTHGALPPEDLDNLYGDAPAYLTD